MSVLCLPAPEQPAGPVSRSIVIFLNCRFYSTLVHTVNYFVWVLIHKAILGIRVLSFNNNKKKYFNVYERAARFFRNIRVDIGFSGKIDMRRKKYLFTLHKQ